MSSFFLDAAEEGDSETLKLLLSDSYDYNVDGQDDRVREKKNVQETKKDVLFGGEI